MTTRMQNLKYPQITTRFLTVSDRKKTDDQPDDNEEPATPKTRTISDEEHQRLLNKARGEERQKLNDTVAAERRRAEDAERELEKERQRIRDAELAAMKPNERYEAQLADMRAQQERDRTEARNREAALANELRVTQLTAYRERAIREYKGRIIAEMVFGNNEVELDASAERAHNEYERIQAEIRAEVEAETRRTSPQPQPEQQPQQPQIPQAWTPPHNPGYVPPTVGALPTPTNVPSVPDSPVSIQEMTTEQAVRSGRYGGEMRQRILSQVSGGPYHPNLGNQPRHMPSMTMPGGVVQPNPQPTGPAGNPNVSQQTNGQQPQASNPVYQNTEPGASQSPQAAIARAGGSNGVAQQAYANRFNPNAQQ